jgi:uncharacterized protein (DUF4415 family)
MPKKKKPGAPKLDPELDEDLRRDLEALVHKHLKKGDERAKGVVIRGKWADPDDAPELTKEYFERADIYRGDKLIRRGRPPSANPKRAIKLRLDPDVLAHFRATGPGWQTRINDVLRRAAKLKRSA